MVCKYCNCEYAFTPDRSLCFLNTFPQAISGCDQYNYMGGCMQCKRTWITLFGNELGNDPLVNSIRTDSKALFNYYRVDLQLSTDGKTCANKLPGTYKQ
jgi:hypothetical protein